MKKTIELLNAYENATGCKPDNAAAEKLGVQRATVSKWRNGIGHPEANTVEAMARAAGLSTAKWVPLIEAERARTQEARATWLRIAGTAATVLLVLGGLLHQSAAAQVQPSNDNGQTIHMRKSTRLAKLAWRMRLPSAWTGWRMQGGVLVPKHRRFQIRPETAERFGEWAKSGSAGGA